MKVFDCYHFLFTVMTTMTQNIMSMITVATGPLLEPSTISTLLCTGTAASVALHDKIEIDYMKNSVISDTTRKLYTSELINFIYYWYRSEYIIVKILIA